MSFMHTFVFNSTVQVHSFTLCTSLGTNDSAVALSRSKEALGIQLKASSIESIALQLT